MTTGGVIATGATGQPHIMGAPAAADPGSPSSQSSTEPLAAADNALDAAIRSSALSKDDVQILLLLANTLIIGAWAYHEVMHG